MSSSDFAVWQENRTEQVWVWFLRLVLLLLPIGAVIRTEYWLALWLTLVLVVHLALYLLAARLLSEAWRRGFGWRRG